MARNAVSLALIERRENQKEDRRAKARAELVALTGSLENAKAKAKAQGSEVDVSDLGTIITDRDGFTWLCGSKKRKAQLTEAQKSAGVEYRRHLDAVHGARVTASYGQATGGSYMDAETRQRLRMDAIERLEEAEDVLTKAHPTLELIVRLVVRDGWTVRQIATAQKKEDAVILEVLRMGLDKLALHYGFRSTG